MRRVIGNGSVEDRGNGHWRLRVYLGVDPVTNMQIRPCRPFDGTRTEAKRTLAEWIQEIENGVRVDADSITFGEYAKGYVTDREGMNMLSPSTLDNDRRDIRRINGYWKDVLLVGIDAPMVRNLYAKLRQDGLSENALHKIHVTLKHILQEAVYDDILMKNPCDRVKVKRPAPKDKRNSLDPSEARRLLSVLESCEELSRIGSEKCTDSRLIAVRIGLATGMRRGEVLGLTWGDIDFKASRLYVSKQYAKGCQLRKPKSEASKRYIILDAETIKHLKRWKQEQKTFLYRLWQKEEERLRKKEGKCVEIEDDKATMTFIDAKGKKHILWKRQTDETPVVTDARGGYHDPANFSKWFRDFCVEYDFGEFEAPREYKDPKSGWKRTRPGKYNGLRFHELRHTQATLLIANGVDIKTVQHRLGHSTPALTIGLYAHASEENDRKAAGMIGDILAERPEDPPNVVNL